MAIKDVYELLIAICRETKYDLQFVMSCAPDKKKQMIRKKYGLEFYKRKKVFDEEKGKNVFVRAVYRTEVFSSVDTLYARLGLMYERYVRGEADVGALDGGS